MRGAEESGTADDRALADRTVCGVRCGTDLIEIDRVARAMKRERFVRRVFTDEEIAFFERSGARPETAAGRFAGKEAVAKLLGTGIRGMSWKDIQILPDSLGAPVVTLTGGALEQARRLGIYKIEISISHARKEAVALATALVWKSKDMNC